MAATTHQQQQEAPAPLPKPKFNFHKVFQEVFSNEQVASYLVSRDKLPPTLLSTEILSRAISIDSALTADPESARFLLKKGREIDEANIHGGGGEASSQSQSTSRDSKNLTTKEVEKLVFLCHTNTEDYCLGTASDERTPLAFLEPPAATVPGIHRLASVKLKNSGMPNAHVNLAYIWLVDGRSTVTLLCFSLGPIVHAEKYFVLLAPYPWYRFPKTIDILETLIAVEEPMCPFCTARGYVQCECSRKMVERMAPSLPSRDQQDPWSLFHWSWVCWEPGLRKYSAALTNYRHNVSVSASLFHHAARILHSSQHLYSKDFQTYVNAIAPYINSQMITWGNLSPSLPGKDDTEFERVLAKHENALVEILDGRRGRDPMNGAVLVALDGNNDEDDGDETKAGKRRRVAKNFATTMSTTHHPSANTSPTTPKHFIADLENPLLEAGPGGLGPSANIINAVAAPSGSKSTGPSLTKQKSASAIGTKGFLDEVTAEMQEEEPELTEEQKQAALEYLKELEDAIWPPGERRACRFCPTSLTRKHDLKRHIRAVHLLEREFRCDVCGDKFIRKTHLDIHLAGVHEKSRRFPCKHCTEIFTSDYSRKKHINALHLELIDTSKAK